MIDINRASAEDFQKLPGIGRELARRMVAYRQKHGSFRRVEELLAIRGIGSKKWKAIKPYLFVGGAARKARGREWKKNQKAKSKSHESKVKSLLKQAVNQCGRSLLTLDILLPSPSMQHLTPDTRLQAARTSACQIKRFFSVGLLPPGES